MKRFISFVMTIIIAMAMMPITVSAESYHETIHSKKFYYIEHVGSGLLLDIDDGHLNENGTQLQIWEKYQGHKNQVYLLIDTGDGWIIMSYASGKIIEVRNSSHDDYPEVAQWDDNGQRCGRWNIIYNTDGTISFENCESGLYMNVFNNYTSNGSKLIQYHSDGTTAEKFKLYPLKTTDVLSAKWTRNISNNEIYWTDMGNKWNISNWTDWTQKDGRSYPTPGYQYLMQIEYLDPKTVGEIIKSRAYVDDAKTQITDIVKGEATEETVAKVLSILGIDDIPFLGGTVSIIQTIWSIEEKNDWNSFLDAVSYDSNGRCSGIIIYTYKVVYQKEYSGPAGNAKVGNENKILICTYERYEYQQWTGDNFREVCYNISGMTGKWEYNFK